MNLKFDLWLNFCLSDLFLCLSPLFLLVPGSISIDKWNRLSWRSQVFFWFYLSSICDSFSCLQHAYLVKYLNSLVNKLWSKFIKPSEIFQMKWEKCWNGLSSDYHTLIMKALRKRKAVKTICAFQVFMLRLHEEITSFLKINPNVKYYWLCPVLHYIAVDPKAILEWCNVVYLNVLMLETS